MASNTSVITNVQQVTPEWLTSLLRYVGVLTQGVVERTALRANDAFNSVVSRLDVTYSPDASASAPPALLLKLNRDHNGIFERLFYQSQLAAPSRPLPIVQCYETAYSPQTGHSHCLLRDLSPTHRSPVTRPQLFALQGVPSQRRIQNLLVAEASVPHRGLSGS